MTGCSFLRPHPIAAVQRPALTRRWAQQPGMKVKEFVAVRQIEDDFRLTGGEALVVEANRPGTAGRHLG